MVVAFHYFSQCISIVGVQPSSVYTGCVVPLRVDCASVCHAGSGQQWFIAQ